MKQETLNSFTEGMVMDTNPLTTPNNILTNCLNGTLITYNGDEFVLQNDFGNGRVEHAKLPSGYIPLGVKEYGGIIYVAAYNPITNLSQVGSFPSPERLISSDELEIPEIEFTDKNFWADDYKENGFFSEFFKTGSITEDVLRPGDEFLIALGTSLSKSQLLNLLSHYLVDVNNKIIKKKKLVNIRLGLITADNSIEYIEDSLLRFTFNEDSDYKHQHWLPIIDDIAPEQLSHLFKTEYEGKDIYNIYKGNSSGNIILVIELESLEEFSVQRQILVKDASNFGVNFICSSTNNDVNSEYYNELVKLEGVDVKLEIPTTDSNNPTILPNTVVNNEIRIKKIKNSKDYLKDPENLKDNIVFYLGEFKQNLEGTSDILKYSVVPYSKYGKYKRHIKKGIIDFQYVNSGIHSLNEFRYYTGNDTTTVAYGLDYYPKEGYSVNEVFMEFYDIANDLSIYHKCRDQDEYSGHFSETIEFVDELNESMISKSDDKLNHYYIQKNRKGNNVWMNLADTTQLLRNNLYLVRVCISENTGINNEPVYTDFYRFLYTTSIFNEEYLKNEILDFETLEITGSLDANITSKLNTRYDTIQDDLGTNSNYSIYYNLDQVNADKGLFENKIRGTYNVTDEMTIEPLLEESSNNKIKKYFGLFNKDSIKIDQAKTEIMGTTFEYDPELIGDDSSDIKNRINELILDYNDWFKNQDDPVKLTINDKHKLTLTTDLLINRFIVANKEFIHDSVEAKILQNYLNESFLRTNALTDVQKRVNGLQLVNIDNKDKPAIVNAICIRGDARADNKSYYYGELLPEAYSRTRVDSDGNPVLDENGNEIEDILERDEDDNYFYRHGLLVYRSSGVNMNLNDYESNNPFNQGLHKILSIYSPYQPTLLPITTFSWKDWKDGMIYYGDDMFPGFSAFYRHYKSGKGVKWTPSWHDNADTILLGWKTTGQVQVDGKNRNQYVLVNFFGLRDYPYDGNIHHNRSNYNFGNRIKNIEGKPNIPITKTFSEKILHILSKFNLVQFEKRMFYLGFPKKYIYTESKNDEVSIDFIIGTNETFEELFKFQWYNRGSGNYDTLPMNRSTIKNMVLNVLNFNSDDRKKIKYNNVDIRNTNFNLSKIEKNVKYSLGKNIKIEDIMSEFLINKTDLFNKIKEDVIYIDDTNPSNVIFIQNPIDAYKNPIDPYKIYVKVNNKFYDMDDTDLKQTFLDVAEKEGNGISPILPQHLFNFYPPNNYKYDYDYYGNYKNIFTTSYADSGAEVGKLNEPLIRNEVLSNVSDSRTSVRYMTWFWSGGRDGKENNWKNNTKGPSVMRNITFDPYYEFIRPLKNTMKPKNSI